MPSRLNPVVVFAVFLAVIVAGCRKGDDDGNPAKPPLEAKVVADPPPGEYRAYTLDVTIATPEAGAALFWDEGRDPEVDASLAAATSATVHLQKTSALHVMVLDAKGRTWGPYTFEYRLTSPSAYLGCQVAAPARKYYRPTEMFAVSVTFDISAALTKVELMLDDTPIPLTVSPDKAHQEQTVQVGPVAGEGAHRLWCRAQANGQTALSAERAFVIDGKPPTVAWASTGGAFRRDNWPGSFDVDVADASSGLASARGCAGAACVPLTHSSGARYRYATALTTGASGTRMITVHAADVAGNIAVSSPLTIDLSGFAEPDALRPPLAIPITTQATADLAILLGAPIEAVRTFTWQAVPSSTVDLTPGFNDYLVRQVGATAWESVSLYRAGASIVLPASAAPWLVYAGNATVPAFEAALIDWLAAGSTTWMRTVFDIPHLFFVNDTNFNSVWDDGDQLYTPASDAFAGAWYSRAALVEDTLVLRPFAAGTTTQAVQVDCTAGCPLPGKLVFERRDALAAFPVAHEAYDVAAWPHGLSVSVQPTELGVWFWDADGDGILSRFEPRAWQAATSPAVTLATADPRAFDYALGRFVGVAYGGAVTGTVSLVAGGVTVQRRPAAAFSDGDGLGTIAAQGRVQVPLLGVAGEFDFWSGADSLSMPFVAFADPGTHPIFIALEVTDETGAPVAAMISRDGDPGATRATDAQGRLQLGVPALMPPPVLFAERDGYLSFAREVTGTDASLRLLSPAVTRQLNGFVQDSLGQPAANLLVRWRSGPYRSAVVTSPDGAFSLPVSGEAGVLTVERETEYLGAAAFALTVTLPSAFVVAEIPAVPAAPWPLGLATLGHPSLVTMAAAVTYYANLHYYGFEPVAGIDVATVRWPGLLRQVKLPGALPAVTAATYASFLSPWSSSLLSSRVECGAWYQEVAGAAGAHAPCWAWLADDPYQRFVLGRLDPVTGFTPHVGLGDFYAYVTQAGLPPLDQVLLFHERLVGQTLQVPLSGGFAAAALPYGQYEVTTLGGAPLTLNDSTATVFEFTAESPPVGTLVVP